jgi:adenylate kinase family enzyme
LVFDVDELELKRRLINRIYCKSCKATSSKEDSLVDFNKKNKIKCRSCGSESGFFSRSDDNHHAISERLKQDKILSNFVKEFYNKKYPEKTFYIDASKHPSSVNLEVESAVSSISNLKKT